MKKLIIIVIAALGIYFVWTFFGEAVAGLAAIVLAWLGRKNLKPKAKEYEEKFKEMSPDERARDTERLVRRGNKRANG